VIIGGDSGLELARARRGHRLKQRLDVDQHGSTAGGDEILHV
jgi:hypothetical protein